MRRSAGSSAPARPAAGAPKEYRFPPFTRARAANGLGLLVAPVTRLPVVSVAVVVDAGAELDPPGKEGIARLTARCLAEGTRSSSPLELAERLEGIGATIEADADWDAATFRFSVVEDRLPSALKILAEMLTEPSFPPEELERLRDERISEIVQLRSEPRGLAEETFSQVIYSDSSRYREPLGGTEVGVAALTRDDVVTFHASRYVPSAVTVIVAGDVEPLAVEKSVIELLEAWLAPRSPRQQSANAENAMGSRITVVHRQDAPQSEIRIGHVGVPRNHPDYFAIVVMNAILGGLFSSRVNLNLRERHAYTYGARSAFDWRRGAGPFVVSTAVETKVTADALREILAEIDAIGEAGVTQEELSLATSYLAGVFPIRFETTAAIADALAQLVIHNLPEGFYDSYRERILAVGAGDVLAAAREHLSPRRLQALIVGDESAVREELEVLRFAPVEKLDRPF